MNDIYYNDKKKIQTVTLFHIDKKNRTGILGS